MVGVCVGDELLEPPSCGQLPGHRMEGLPAACRMKEAPERQAREPEGSGERNGRELSGCDSSVCGYRLFTVRRSLGVGTPFAPGSLKQKRQAREACSYLFCLLLFGGML